MAQVNPTPGETPVVGAKRSLYGPVHPGKWTTGLCDCGIEEEIVVGPGEADDQNSNEVIFAVPPVMYARLAHRWRGSNTTLSCCLYAFCWLWVGWAMAKGLRAKLREKYALPEEPCGDCLVHLCCSPFAVFQEYREMEAREGVRFWEAQQQPATQTEPPEQQEVTELTAL